MKLFMHVGLYIAIFCLIIYQTGVRAEAPPAVVVLLDFTKASGSEWSAQINFLMKLLGEMKGARTALIGIMCPAKILTKLEPFDESAFRNAISSAGTSRSKGTDEAFNLAHMMLSAEPYGEGKVIIMSDGESRHCFTTPSSVSEYKIASNWKQWRRNVFYIPLGPVQETSKQTMAKLAGREENVVEVKSFAEASQSFIEQLAARILGPAGAPQPLPPPQPPPAATTPSTTTATKKPTTTTAATARTTATKPTTTPTPKPTTTSEFDLPSMSDDSPPAGGCTKISITYPEHAATVLFAIDSTESITGKRWKQQVHFVIKVSSLLGAVRRGVLSLACKPEVSIAIRNYTHEEFRHLMKKKLKHLRGTADIHAIIDLARNLIFREPSRLITLMIFSDPRKKTVSQDCSNLKGKKNAAEELRKLGVNIMYMRLKIDNPQDGDVGMELTGSARQIVDITLPGNVFHATKAVFKTESAMISSCLAKHGTKGETNLYKCPSGSSMSPSLKSIVFIIDGSVAAKDLDWEKVTEFVVQMVEQIGEASAGVVDTSCPSETLASMGYYNSRYLKDVLKVVPTGGKNDMNGAFDSAETILKQPNDEKPSEQYVIIIAKSVDDEHCEESEDVESAFKIAERMRQNGVKLFYLSLKPLPPSPSEPWPALKNITGDEKHILSVKEENKLGQFEYDNLMKKFCS